MGRKRSNTNSFLDDEAAEEELPAVKRTKQSCLEAAKKPGPGTKLKKQKATRHPKATPEPPDLTSRRPPREHTPPEQPVGDSQRRSREVIPQDRHSHSSESDKDSDEHSDEDSEDSEEEDVLVKAKQKFQNSPHKVQHQEEGQEAVDYIIAQLDALHDKQDKMLEMLQQALNSSQPRSDDVPPHHIVKGTNAMHWITRDATQFALDLMTALFTKEEMQGHLAFITAAGKKRTSKETLPRDKIELIVKLVKERFPNSANMHEIRNRMNQKCRDSTPRSQNSELQSKQAQPEDGNLDLLL